MTQTVGNNQVWRVIWRVVDVVRCLGGGELTLVGFLCVSKHWLVQAGGSDCCWRIRSDVSGDYLHCLHCHRWLARANYGLTCIIAAPQWVEAPRGGTDITSRWGHPWNSRTSQQPSAGAGFYEALFRMKGASDKVDDSRMARWDYSFTGDLQRWVTHF